jgi:endonuclease YncB( thermonuclease family)
MIQFAAISPIALAASPLAGRRASFPRLALIFLCLALAPVRAFAAPCGVGQLHQTKVDAIGDRLEFTLADGRRMRLAGLDVPDPSRGDTATATAARAFATHWLLGQSVDVGLATNKLDRWGRVVGDLFAPPLGAPNAAPISVALALLEAGEARVWPEPEAAACAAERHAAEQRARDKRLGLWRDPYYGLIEATDVENLQRRDGQFTLVAGTPSRIGEGHSRYFVDFGLRRGFTVVIPKKRAKDFERAGMAISALVGARVIVRGALDDRFSPRMAISGPDEIERVEANGR